MNALASDFSKRKKDSLACNCCSLKSSLRNKRYLSILLNTLNSAIATAAT